MSDGHKNGQLHEARAALAWRPIPFIFVIVIVIALAANFIFVVLTYASVASGLFLLLFLLFILFFILFFIILCVVVLRRRARAWPLAQRRRVK